MENDCEERHGNRFFLYTFTEWNYLKKCFIENYNACTYTNLYFNSRTLARIHERKRNLTRKTSHLSRKWRKTTSRWQGTLTLRPTINEKCFEGKGEFQDGGDARLRYRREETKIVGGQRKGNRSNSGEAGPTSGDRRMLQRFLTYEPIFSLKINFYE